VALQRRKIATVSRTHQQPDATVAAVSSGLAQVMLVLPDSEIAGWHPNWKQKSIWKLEAVAWHAQASLLDWKLWPL